MKSEKPHSVNHAALFRKNEMKPLLSFKFPLASIIRQAVFSQKTNAEVKITNALLEIKYWHIVGEPMEILSRYRRIISVAKLLNQLQIIFPPNSFKH